MENAEAVAKINDRLRKSMPVGQLNIHLSSHVETSPNRPKIIQAVRTYTNFDPEIDANYDHSIGVVAIAGHAYVFRFTYEDDRYDYSKETGKRVLSIHHVSEFRSLKLGKRVQDIASKIAEHKNMGASSSAVEGV